MSEKNKILIRFDDICPSMNWEQWGKAKDLLDSHGVKALIGVIPDNHDPDLKIEEPKEDFWKYIKSLKDQGFSIAMHGYQHVFDIRASGLSTSKKHSEFAGHSFEEQNRRILEGKRILAEHGIDTDIFFAPAHSYDDNTLKALARNGFRYISDGKSCKPYKRHGITCFPERSGGIPKIKSNGGYYTVVLHAHEWTRPGGDLILKKMNDICADPCCEIVSFDKYISQSCGNHFYQRLYEWCYVSLAGIKHKLLDKR